MKCRFCQHELIHEFIDLNNAPPSNSFLTREQLAQPEIFYPLKLFVCDHCWLVQIDEYKKANTIFDQEYIYFSSYSKSWLAHAKNYVDDIVERFNFNQQSLVIEIASNDGYLLQFFKQKQIPCLGIEPTKSTALVCKEKDISVIEAFFGEQLAIQLLNHNQQADLLIGNNVLAHVPDINDFVIGLKIALKKTGVITLEFPHLLQLIAQNQFDTIYHEHFSYFSFYAVKRIFNQHELEIFDVAELATHGGSLRIYVKHLDNDNYSISDNIALLEQKETSQKITTLDYYQFFQQQANKIKNDLLMFLIEQYQCNKTVVAYGAAAKGNTLLNYCGIKKDLIKFVVDASPYKQNKFLPCSHIPVVSEESIRKTKPDFILILPWNIKDEIIDQLNYVREWDCKFIISIPALVIL
jgi:hypothetical protein